MTNVCFKPAHSAGTASRRRKLSQQIAEWTLILWIITGESNEFIVIYYINHYY